jgi:hypothetical protein
LFPIVGTTPTQYGTYGVPVTWSNGAPTASATAVTTYVGTDGVGKGFTISVPSGTNLRNAKVYLHLYNGSATFTAHLSDSSAPDYVSNVMYDGTANNLVYTLAFRASSGATALQLRFEETASLGGSFGVCAVTLY